jgi:hypothetical protein
MTFIPSLVKDDFEYFRSPPPINSLSDAPVNLALIAVAQEVARLLQQCQPFQVDSNNQTERVTADRLETIAIRALNAKRNAE